MARASFSLYLTVGAAIMAMMAGCGGGGGGGTSIPAALGTITGNVSDVPLDSGTRAPGSPVTVFVEGTNISTQTDADGNFTLTNVPAGMHTLVAGTQHQAGAVVVDVQGGRETNVGQMQLREAGQISGLVTAEATHEPIPGALVTVTELVYNTDSEMPHPVRVKRTDANGSYTVSALPAGDYLVAISKQGYQTASLRLTVQVGTTTVGDAALVAGPTKYGTLKGTVYLQSSDGAARPIPGVLVRLIPSGLPVNLRPLPDEAVDGDGNKVDLYGDWPPPTIVTGTDDVPPMPPLSDPNYYTFTDVNGAYIFEGLPAGQYAAVAVRPGLVPQQHVVTITANAVTIQDFYLSLVQIVYGVIEGTVTSKATGAPIEGAAVRAILPSDPPPPPALSGAGPSSDSGGAIIRPDAANCIMSTRTDASGHYMLKVPTEVCGVYVVAQGYEPYYYGVEVIPNGTVTINPSLIPPLQPDGCELSGKVTIQDTPSGPVSPAEGAVVVATPRVSPDESAPVVVREATADADGNYSMRLSAMRTYDVYAAKDGRRSATITVTMNGSKVRDLLIGPSGGTDPPPPPPL